MATIGDAEEFESTAPPLFYLGRKLLPGYFGYGKYRGGAGNSAVHWCVQPGKHLGLTRPNGGLSCTPSVGLGMSGAYPGPASFMISARGTNLEIWKTDCPELALQDNDLFVDAAGASGGWGDPLDREPLAVIRDLNDGSCPRYDFVREMHGVIARQDTAGRWQLDEAATHAKRAELRRQRLAESLAAEQWWTNERRQVEGREFLPEVLEMYDQSLSFAKFRHEFTRFWQLPSDFACAKE